MTTSAMREIALGMTNFDNSIDDGFSDALKSEPGRVFGRHSAWDFNGEVWFENNKFHERVWVYHVPVKILSADSLRELMDMVCSEFGYE